LAVCFDAYLGSIGIVGADRVQIDYSEAVIMEDTKSIIAIEVTHEEAISSWIIGHASNPVDLRRRPFF
jgi:hypothetical protein